MEIEWCDIKVSDGSFESEESSTALVMWHIFLTYLFQLKRKEDLRFAQNKITTFTRYFRYACYIVLGHENKN